ncbi:GNAT family N-acetyltransferase [Ancylothrix sp. C2]|uniref:GNAT family N-acetyltransferase n=1 Tax=Ancylothrix sp. D3o TaxID=2953691 RepID=UPI0021BB9783|nr:GNAT family N-acetyltransferase [Ancylothrix sp. D3o]MCT7951738.1 GNAT family N-acetyltransferase [Ancylothrix sp. D3o]
MNQIQTQRLVLRKFTPQDIEELYRLFNDPDVMHYMGGVRTRQATEQRLSQMIDHCQHGFSFWAVIRKSDQQLLGRCGLIYLDNTPEVELGYTFFKEFWGQGYATEAGLACLKYGFEIVNLERVVAITHPENTASRHVMEKLGMKYEKEAFYYNTNVVYYALSRAKFQEKYPNI